MTDLQILTIALAVIFPVSAMILGNSRVGEVSKRLDDLKTEIGGMEKRLAEKIDNAFAHMELLLTLHEERHHNK